MLQQHGSVLYNGEGFKDFFPERTAAYVDQVSLQLTVHKHTCTNAASFHIPTVVAAQPRGLVMTGQPATGQVASGVTRFCSQHQLQTAILPFLRHIQVAQAAWVAQVDNHIPDMTVRETFDFAARVQGSGSKAGAAFGTQGWPDCVLHSTAWLPTCCSRRLACTLQSGVSTCGRQRTCLHCVMSGLAGCHCALPCYCPPASRCCALCSMS